MRKYTLAVLFAALLALPVTAAAATPQHVDIPCVQKAVDKRENAVFAAWNARDVAIRAALVKRHDALKAAWGIADEATRKKALRDAWAQFKAARKLNSRNKLEAARNAAWDAFQIDAIACGVPKGVEPGGSRGADAT